MSEQQAMGNQPMNGQGNAGAAVQGASADNVAWSNQGQGTAPDSSMNGSGGGQNPMGFAGQGKGNGGMPDQQSGVTMQGFSGQGNGMPGGQTSSPQGAYSGGMPQGGMPQGGMPQGGMPQGGMPQGGMPQGGMPQGGMPQGGMPQGGMPQGGMPQGGMPQGGMPQGAGYGQQPFYGGQPQYYSQYAQPAHLAGHGQGPGMAGVIEELANGGNGLSSLSKMLDFDDKDFWKGALLGAAVVLLLTNDSVQNTLFRTGAKAKEKVRSGVDKMRETVQQATEKTESTTAKEKEGGDE